MRGRGFSEGLSAALGSPTAGAALAAIGLVSALLAALTNEAAAVVTAAALLVLFAAIAVYTLRVNAAFDGAYRIVESETVWDLRDPDATVAVATKVQRVRFNYKTSVVQDTAKSDTGDDPFADYAAEHGSLLGVFQRGVEYHAVIGLDREAQRGDSRKLVSHRTLRNQFPKPRGEWIEIEQSQRGHTSLAILFPPAHAPRNLQLWSSRTDRTTDIEDQVATEGGRKVFRLAKRRMRRGERYRITWDW